MYIITEVVKEIGFTDYKMYTYLGLKVAEMMPALDPKSCTSL